MGLIDRPAPGILARRGGGLILVLALTLGVLGGCTPEPRLPLRVGTNLWPGYEPLYLARDLGYYTDSEVRLVEYASATEVLHAFRNGAIDAAALTLDEVLLLGQNQYDLRIVAVLDISEGADALLGGPGVHSLAGLRGRRIGVENTAVGGYLLARALQSAGLTAEAVRIVPLEVHQHEPAFVRGEIDAVVTFEPVRSRLLARGARVLFDSRRIPGEILDVLAVRHEALAGHAPHARQLIAGWLRAVNYLHDQPRDAATRMAPRLGVSPEAFLQSLSGLHIPNLADNRRLLGGTPPALATTAGRLAATMRSQRLLREDVAVDSLVDARLLPEANP